MGTHNPLSPPNESLFVPRIDPSQILVASQPLDSICPLEELFIPLSLEDCDTLCQPWRLSVICKLLGKSFNASYLKLNLQKTWKTKNGFVGKGFYTVRFKDEEQFKHVIAMGHGRLTNPNLQEFPQRL